MADKPAYKFGESFDEEPQQMVGGASTVNPDDDDLPYIPSMPKVVQQPKPVQFVDMNNPESFARVENGNRQPAQPQYNPQMEGQREPDFNSAEKNMATMSKIMDKVNNLANETNGDENYSRSNTQGIGIAIENLNKAIKTLNDIDYWIPDGKEEYAPQLKKIAQAIIKALSAYTSKVETLR